MNSNTQYLREANEHIMNETDWDLWRNKKDGTFVLVDLITGTTTSIQYEDIPQLGSILDEIVRITNKEIMGKADV